MKKLLFFFILLGYHAVSQTVYQAHEVEQRVVPSGGILLLNQFITSNIQIPLRSSVKGIKAKVFVKGIVETDGTMTGLEVVKGIDSLCDKEALRVLGLYKAWQPAMLQGRKVRQTAFTHVMFEAPAKEDFDTTRWSLVPYYDEKMVRTTDPARYRYRSVIHLDDQGNYDKNLVYEDMKYPAEASRRRLSGKIYISFVVCEDGSLCDYKLEKSVQKDIDQEALRVVKKMSGKWEPGELRGQKVRVKYNLPVSFQFL